MISSQGKQESQKRRKGLLSAKDYEKNKTLKGDNNKITGIII